MTNRETTLVLGGARSGKSAFAEGLLRETAAPRVYVATAEARDEEMKRRIARHRASRSDGWRTIEEPLALVETLAREARGERAVLVDCLTLWLSNLIEAGRDVDVESKRLTEWLRGAEAKTVLVANEVGLGLVPETSLGRSFRDAQGRLNQMVAAAANNVAFVAAGLPIWLKRRETPSSRGAS